MRGEKNADNGFMERIERISACQICPDVPNPFNPLTTIAYDLPKASAVTFTVYNVTGQKVATLMSARQQAGRHTVVWDASAFANGVYLYRLEAGEFVATKRMLLLK